MTQATQTILAGYKQTEIGVIPDDWDVKKFGKIVNRIVDNRGKTPPYSARDSVELIETASISFVNSYPDYSKIVKFVSEYTYKNWFRDHPKKGYILISTVGEYSGSSAILEEDRGTVAQNLIGLKMLDEMNPKFVFYWTRSSNYRKQLDQVMMSQAQPSLRVPWLLNFQIPFPTDPEEQTAIATALSDTDVLIEKLEKLITKKKAVKLGAMQQLLTGKKRLPGFSGEWEVKKLGEIFRVTRGQVLSTRKMKDSRTPDYRYPVYSSQTLNNGLTGYFNNFLFENAITWTTDGANAGDVKYRNGKFYCTNVCGVLLSDQGYANWCIAEIFGMISKKYVSYVGNPKLMNNVVKNIPVLIPLDVKEQTAIATVLSDMDAEIEKLENKLNKYRQIKTGMTQQLLTGKIRLLKN